MHWKLARTFKAMEIPVSIKFSLFHKIFSLPRHFHSFSSKCNSLCDHFPLPISQVVWLWCKHTHTHIHTYSSNSKVLTLKYHTAIIFPLTSLSNYSQLSHCWLRERERGKQYVVVAIDEKCVCEYERRGKRKKRVWKLFLASSRINNSPYSKIYCWGNFYFLIFYTHNIKKRREEEEWKGNSIRAFSSTYFSVFLVQFSLLPTHNSRPTVSDKKAFFIKYMIKILNSLMPFPLHHSLLLTLVNSSL